MEQYIPKAAVLAEIEKLYQQHSSKEYIDEAGCVLDKLEDILDTLEVKEVDLEKEIRYYISSNFFGSETLGFFANRTKEEPNDQDIALCAKHFFELGMQASNPLTWEDIANINDIVSEILKECKDIILYDTQESFCKEVLKRFKKQNENRKRQYIYL